MPVSDALKLSFIAPLVQAGASSPLHHEMCYAKGLGRTSARRVPHRVRVPLSNQGAAWGEQ